MDLDGNRLQNSCTYTPYNGSYITTIQCTCTTSPTPHDTVPLYEVPGLLCCEAEEDVQTVHVSGVESDRVIGLNLHILVGQEVIRKLWGASHFTGSLQTQYQEVQHQTVVLDYE